MKSLFIVNDFPPIPGGQSAYYFYLCKALPKDQIIVLAPQMPGCEAIDAQLPFPVIRRKYVISFPLIEKFVKILGSLIHARRIIADEMISIVHCAHVMSTGIVSLIIKKLDRIPYVLYIHSADIMEYERSVLFRPLLKMILRNAQWIMTNSVFTKYRVLRLDPEVNSKIILCFPRMDPALFSQEPDLTEIRERFGLKNNPVILTLSRLVRRKGHDMVIKALPKILSQYPDAVYLIVGQGPELRRLKYLVRKHQVEKNVIFATFEDASAREFYYACDIFIMPSRIIEHRGDAEGFGMVFLEANACGKPVIGGNSGGIPDAVIDSYNGFLVDPLNDDQIAFALIKLLKDPAIRRRVGENGRLRVQKKFNFRNGIPELNFLFSHEQNN